VWWYHLKIRVASLGNYAPFGTVSIGGEAVPAIGIGYASVPPRFLTMLSGEQPSGSHEVVLGARTLQKLHRHVGDAVPAEIDGHIRSMRIVGTAVFASFSRGCFDATDLGDGAAFSASTLSKRDPATNCAGTSPCYNFFLVRYRPGTNLVAAGARLHKAVVAAGCPVGSCNVVAGQRPDDINDYSRVRETPLLLAGVLALLAIAILAHVLVTGIRRHRRDLAVLRTLGLLRRQMLATIAWDASTIAAVTLALGIPLGVVAGRISWSLFADSVGVPVDVEIPLLSVLLIIPATFAIANITAAWPGWLAGHLRAATILRDE
jgi:FtsX-like permease family